MDVTDAVELRDGGSTFILTTNAGLEAVTKAEVLAATVGLSPPVGADDVTLRPWGCFGRVRVSRPTSSDARPTLLSSRKALHAASSS